MARSPEMVFPLAKVIVPKEVYCLLGSTPLNCDVSEWPANANITARNVNFDEMRLLRLRAYTRSGLGIL